MTNSGGSEVEYAFKVRLSEVSAKFSMVSEGVLAAGATPFFRCDFDGKQMQSENCSLPGDPVWTFRNAFEYRLLEPSIDSLVASLAARSVTFEVFVGDGGSRQALVGRCGVDLLSIATGASKFQLRLTPSKDNNNNAAADLKSPTTNAVLNFNLTMEQQSVIHLSLQQLNFASLPTPTATKLHYLLLEGGSAIETTVLTPCTSPYFDALSPVQCRTSMRALLNTSVRITLLDAMRGDSPIGTFDLPIAEILLNADEIGSASGTFKKNLYSSREYHQSFTALVTGVIMIERLPAFAQLQSGQNMDGEISGKPLLPSCFLPPRYVKRPSKLPDFQHKPMALGVDRPSSSSSAAAAGSGYSFARGGGGGGSGDYIPAQVSSIPALSSPQRKMYEPSYSGGAGGGGNNFNSSFSNGGQPYRSPHRPQQNGGGLNSSRGGGGGGNGMGNLQAANAPPFRSPVAKATSNLIEQQDDAAIILDQQQKRLSETKHELLTKQLEETEASQQRLDGLAAEEHSIKEKLGALGGQISYLHTQLETLADEQQKSGGDANVPGVTGGLGGGPLSQLSATRHCQQQQQQQENLNQSSSSSSSFNNVSNNYNNNNSNNNNIVSMIKQQQGQVDPSGRTMQDMEKELSELLKISDELSHLQGNLRLHVEVDGTLRRTSLGLIEESRNQLNRDNQALAEVEYRMSNPNSGRGEGGGVDLKSAEFRTISPTRSRSHNHVPPLQLGGGGGGAGTTHTGSYSSSAASSGRGDSSSPSKQQKYAPRKPDPHPQGGVADNVYTSPGRQLKGSTRGELVVAAVSGNNNSARRTAAIRDLNQPQQQQHERPISPHRDTSQQIPSTNNHFNTSTSAAAGGAGGGGGVGLEVQAMNSAIVNNDIAGIYAAARANPRAIHPRSLLLACTQRSPNPRVVDTLLELKPQLLQMTDASTGRTALHCACAADTPNAEAVRVLLDAGASLNEYDAEGLAAFHVALLNVGDFGNILRHALLDYGANPMQPTQGGMTPALLCATSDSHVEAVMFLKQAGADLYKSAPDQKRLPSTRAPPAASLTPLDKAEQCGAVAVRRFLMRFMNDSKPTHVI